MLTNNSNRDTTAGSPQANRRAISDNSFETNYGPSSPGAINLIGGHDGGLDLASSTATTSVDQPPICV